MYIKSRVHEAWVGREIVEQIGDDNTFYDLQCSSMKKYSSLSPLKLTG